MALVYAGSSPVVHPKAHPAIYFQIVAIYFTVMKRGSSNMDLKTIKRAQKKNPDELQDYLQFKRRGTRVQSKKGKGAYSRKSKYKNLFENF